MLSSDSSCKENTFKLGKTGHTRVSGCCGELEMSPLPGVLLFIQVGEFQTPQTQLAPETHHFNFHYSTKTTLFISVLHVWVVLQNVCLCTMSVQCP